MNRSEICELLDARGIWYEITEHPAVFNMAEVAAITLPYPDNDAKSLFVRDDKKRNHYLITVRGDKKVDLKAFRRTHETRPLSFASADELLAILGLIPGAVTPLGVLNDDERQVEVFLDQDFRAERGVIGVHPNENTATLWLRFDDLVDIITEHGNTVRLVAIPTSAPLD